MLTFFIYSLSSHPQASVELIQHQTHGARQVAHIWGFLVQGILEHLKILHPFYRKAVINNVSLHQQKQVNKGENIHLQDQSV